MEKLKPLPVSEWPAIDRIAWEAAFTQGRGLFDTSGHGLALSPRTAKNYRTANGIWLRYLSDTNQLDPEAPADVRVTPERLDGWVDALRRAGRINSTITQYLISLHGAVRLIAPLSDTSFILKPRGIALSRVLPSEPKPSMAIDTNDVMRQIRALHDTGKKSSNAALLRDAALMGLFATRAPRVSSVAAMCLGQHLRLLPNDLFECQFPKTDVKGGRRKICWPLDEECSAMMHDYLARARPVLKSGVSTEALWLGDQGEPLDHLGLTKIFRRLTLAWFGVSMGPHMARKWLRSTAARRSPEAAFDAAEVMAHSPRVSLRHYNEAGEIGAAQRYGRTIRDLRQQTEGIAERFFAEREDF